MIECTDLHIGDRVVFQPTKEYQSYLDKLTYHSSDHGLKYKIGKIGILLKEEEFRNGTFITIAYPYGSIKSIKIKKQFVKRK